VNAGKSESVSAYVTVFEEPEEGLAIDDAVPISVKLTLSDDF
jgi:hypothetical protein